MDATFVNFPAANQITVEQETLDDAPLTGHEVIVRSETSVISAGTELARLQGLEGGMDFPARPGYGTIGIVEQIGPDVDDVQVGDRVFFAGKHASVQRFEHGQDHQWGWLFPAPKDLDPIDAVMACMAQIAFTGPHLSEVKLGDTVAVFGLGLVGNFAAQLFRARGARVIGIDPASKRCEQARACGIVETIDCAPADQVQALLDATGGEGADITVDAVGHSAIIGTAVKATRLSGQVVLLGTPRAPMDGDLTEAFQAIHMKLLTVRGAHMWTMPLREQRGVPKSVQWAMRVMFDQIRSGTLHTRPVISHIITPDEAPAAYAGLKDRPNDYTGVVIDWR